MLPKHRDGFNLQVYMNVTSATVYQKRPICMSKETYLYVKETFLYVKRGLFVCDKRHGTISQKRSLSHILKSPLYSAFT